MRIFSVFLFLLSAVLVAEESKPAPALTEEQKQILEKVQALKYETGKVAIGDGLAVLDLNEHFKFLNAKDTSFVLEKLWGNPPSSDMLGMIVPAEFHPLISDSWFVILHFESSGYVRDNDANTIKYDDLLKDMQKATLDANAERIKQGYEAVQLIGWATPPSYDNQRKILYWAKEVRFGDAKENTLNFNIRVLGRKGVLNMNAVAGMHSLPDIQSHLSELVGLAQYNEGHRYQDFNEKSDLVAEYGLAALVAGGVLAKTGLLKAIFVGILAMKKFIIIGLCALGSFLYKLSQAGGKIPRTRQPDFLR